MQARPCAGAPLTGLHHTRRFATPDCVRSNLVVARAAADVNKDAGPSVRKRPPRGPSTQPMHDLNPGETYVAVRNDRRCGPVDFSVPVDDDNKPRNILEEIVWHKNTEVERMRSRKPLPMLKQLASRVVPARDFKATLLKRLEETGKPGLIAEVKKASPSRGVIQPDFDPVRIAKAYEQGGAGCLSVLTDSKYFQGSFEYLQAIRRSGVQCPLLCKDFIVEGYQIFNARVHGADAVLLIAAVLTNSDMQYFLAIAESLGMQCLIEVHTEAELQRCLELPKLEKHLLGINNRDLSTFKVELENTKRIMDAPVGQQVKAQDLIMVGESGIFTPEDVAFVQSAGCRAILVGESIVKQGDAASAVRQLLQLQD